MPEVKEKTQKKSEVILDLNAKREKAEELLEQAVAYEEEITQEGRALTEEEYAHVESLVEEANTLTEEYQRGLEEDKRAAMRTHIEESTRRLAQIPDAKVVLNSGGLRHVTRMHPRGLDDPKWGFDDMGEFAAMVWSAGTSGGSMDPRLGKVQLHAAATGMSQGIGADGGFAVPPEFRQTIWQNLQEDIDNLLPMCDQFPVTGESLTMPASGETSRVNGSRYGGIRGYWLAEAAQITTSAPKLRQMRLEPQELAVLVYVTDKLLRNAPALNTFLTRAATEEILFVVNDAIINGDGVGKPEGILNSNATISVAKETGQPANTVVVENINKMYSRMHARARMGAVWLINQDVEPQLEALTATAGTGGFPVYLPQGSGGPTITESPNARLKGRPVLPVEYCQTLGTKGDIILVNLGFYAVGMQGMMRDDISIHLRFDYAETAFRFMFSIDGRTWLNSAITPFKGADTLSPYVTLATRS